MNAPFPIPTLLPSATTKKRKILVADLLCGAGGSSTGCQLALAGAPTRPATCPRPKRSSRGSDYPRPTNGTRQPPCPPSGATAHLNFAWTEERVVLLRKRWAENASCSAIGIELGVSRNSVIRKAHRLGLHRDVPRLPRGGAGRPTKEQQDRRVAAAARDPWKARAIQPKPVVLLPVEPKPPRPPQPVRSDPLPSGTIALLDLRAAHCRWPSGDTDIRFCGQPRTGGEINGMGCPYCAGHARMAYVAPRTPAQREGDERGGQAAMRRLGRAA